MYLLQESNRAQLSTIRFVITYQCIWIVVFYQQSDNAQTVIRRHDVSRLHGECLRAVALI